MNKRMIDIILKLAFIAGCIALGLGASDLIEKYRAEQAAKEDVLEQFIDICIDAGADEIYY